MAKKDSKEFDISTVNDFLSKNNALVRLSKDDNGNLETPRYSTGLVLLDALTAGGFPQGKIISIGSKEGVGKTTIILQALCNIIIKYNKRVYYVDVEGGATPELLQSMGYFNLLHTVDNPDGKLYIITGFKDIQNISKILKLVSQDPETAAFVIDSDTSVIDGRDLEEDDLGTGKNAVGKNARMWSSDLGVFNAVVEKSNMCLIIVHQSRTDLSNSFMATTKSAGGRAVKHYTSAEIWGRKAYWIDENGQKTTRKDLAKGAYVALSTEKNRLTIPFVKVEFPLFFGRGVSNLDAYKQWLMTHTIIDETTGEQLPLLDKKGAGWYTIRMPELNNRCQGDAAINEILSNSIDYISKYVTDNGGFTLLPDNDDSVESEFDR